MMEDMDAFRTKTAQLRGTGIMNLGKAVEAFSASADVLTYGNAPTPRVPMARVPLHLLCGRRLTTAQRELAARLYKYCYASGNAAIAAAVGDLQGVLERMVPMGSSVWGDVAAVYALGIAKHGPRALDEADAHDCAHAAMGHLARCNALLASDPLDAETGYPHSTLAIARMLMVIACERVRLDA